MKMTRRLLSVGVPVLASVLALSSCNEGIDWADVDGAAPTMEFAADVAHVEPGMNVNLKGKITDADGIKTITLKCPELLLDKTIDIIDIYGEPVKEYDLDYTFQTARRTEGDAFTVIVTVTDIGGRSVTKEFGSLLDADLTAPYFSTKPGEEITVLIKKETAIKLNVEATDNKEVNFIEIDLKKVNGTDTVAVAGFPKRIEGNGNSKLALSEKLVVPSEIGKYVATITAGDNPPVGEPNIATAKSIINVMELPDFPELYLADVASAAELNSDLFGVPMAMDHVGKYKYRVRYYNEKAGTEVCFLAQKTDFGPICFAPSKDNAAELGDDPDEVNKLVLDKGGVYYEFLVDTYARTVTSKTYGVNEAINPVAHMQYGGNLLNTWWDWNVADPWMQEFYFGPAGGPGDVKRMEQDKNNPNIWYCYSMDYESGATADFMVHNWHSHGWWNFVTWRSDNSAEPSKFVYYGNYHPDNAWYKGNKDYFDWKYGQMSTEEYNFMYPSAGAFNLDKWSDEGYRKNFIGDNWVKASIKKGGKYTFKIDLHAERGWMYME